MVVNALENSLRMMPWIIIFSPHEAFEYHRAIHWYIGA